MEKKIHAKDASKWGMIFMAAWIAGWSAFTFVTGKAIAMADIITSGLSIGASFSPVFFSIILDKLKEFKFGSK